MFHYAVIAVTVLAVCYWASTRHPRLRPLATGASAVCCLVYIAWRATVIPFEHGWWSALLGVVLYVAEILGVVMFFDFIYLFSKEHRIEHGDLPLNEHAPTVDVLVCTYNEPVKLLRMTVAACMNLQYPEGKMRVWVCDDGRRQEVRSMCEMLGAGYITREDNAHAKAGNINHALSVTDGELFAVFDADMIPKKDFLLRTVSHFSDEKLAFVQTPQAYYNGDSYQYSMHRKDIPNEQDFFMRHIQEARAANGAVLHVGTNAVFRRRCVMEIGGYPTTSITEDMALGMLLQAHGCSSLLINDELAFGLSATTFADLVVQRDRWCRGNLQVLKKHNPLTQPGLTIPQRIAYFDGALYWFANLQKMVFVLVPIVFLFTQTAVLDCTLEILACFYVPYMLGQLLAFKVLAGGGRTLLWSHLYEVAMAPHLCVSIAKELLGFESSFKVTSKDPIKEESIFQYRIAAPHLVLAAATLAGWIVCARCVASGEFGAQGLLINLVWSAYNLLALGFASFVALQKHVVRHSPRLVPATVEKVEIEVDESPSGAVDDTTAAKTDESAESVAGKAARFEGVLLDISGGGIGVRLSRSVEFSPGTRVRTFVRGASCCCTVSHVEGDIVSFGFCELTAEALRALMGVFQDGLHSYHRNDKRQLYEE